jgi:lipopolysaccharide export system permease protein
MHKLEKYIIKNLSLLFLSIFTPLFAIASIIFLIKLATYTAVIQLNVTDMLKLYVFILPDLLFYTLPISFFVSTAITFNKLSNDNEMIVIFSLGVNPKSILKIILKPAIMLSVILATISFVIIPHTTTLSKNFIQYKKSEAKLNLSASQYGHKFGKWLLYIGHENNDKLYSDVFLFNKDKKEEVIIVAKTAEIINNINILKLKLSNGQAYSYSKNKFTQLDFQQMIINNTLSTNLITYESPIQYWFSDIDKEKKKKWFIIYSILSLFPLITIFLSISFGVVHVRHQKAKIYVALLLSTILYYGSATGLYKSLGYNAIPIVLITSLVVSYFIFKYKIVKKF